MDRGAWQAPWGCKESDTTERLSAHTPRFLKSTAKKKKSHFPIFPIPDPVGTQRNLLLLMKYQGVNTTDMF